ncbi:hypothetical protein QTP88_008717 [Uroleucon formosanum]
MGRGARGMRNGRRPRYRPLTPLPPPPPPPPLSSRARYVRTYAAVPYTPSPSRPRELTTTGSRHCARRRSPPPPQHSFLGRRQTGAAPRTVRTRPTPVDAGNGAGQARIVSPGYQDFSQWTLQTA